MTLRVAKQTIRQWIRTHFDDQRLAEVYAFNRDKQMSYANPCACFLGVTGAANLHREKCVCTNVNPPHYLDLAVTNDGLIADEAYNYLAIRDDGLRRIRLSAILRAEMRRRERERALADPEPEYPLTCGDDEPEELDQIPYDQAVCPKEVTCS